jgi:capsular polysaccharide biosynthesis protein
VEEEIDLREYLDVIIRRWKWIVAITLVAVITATIVSFFLMAPVYEAKAGVVILKSKSEITFEPKYRTLTEEELAGAGVDIASRRKALEALVENSSLAVEVIAELRPTLDPEEREVEGLLDMVKAETTGDLIEIVVRSTDPRKAADIANAWGEVYERYVNELYSGKPQSAEAIGTQVVGARKTYEESQEALARFMGDNRLEILSREMGAKQNALADYYATKQGLDRLLGDAQALRDQLRGRTSPTGAANHLSILLLRASAFTLLAPDLPAQLQLALNQEDGIESSTENQLGDVDSLISVLEARRAEVQSFISEGSIQQELLGLQEQLEREQARQRELTQARDLAWETYQTLARKEAEVEVSAQVTDTEVRFAVPAVEPKKPVAPKKMLNIAIAGVLGLMGGIFAAFGADYWRKSGG